MLRSSLRLARSTSRASAPSTTNTSSVCCSAAASHASQDDDGRLPLSHSFSSASGAALSCSTATNWKQQPHCSQSRLFSTMLSSCDSKQKQPVIQQQQQTRRHQSQLATTTALLHNPLLLLSSPRHNNHPRLQQQHQQHHRQQIRTKVFVSRHNDMNITSNQILDYCSSRGILNVNQARVTSSHVILQECPFCSKPTNNKADNFYKCYVNIGGGAYFCHRCGSGGSWFDFKSTLRGHEHNVVSVTGGSGSAGATQSRPRNKGASSSSSRQPPPSSNGKATALPIPKQRLQACYISNLMDSKPAAGSNGVAAAAAVAAAVAAATATDKNATITTTDSGDSSKALQYLQETRGLELRTLRKYGVGKATYHFPSDKNGQYVATECITFPWIMSVADVKEQEALRGAEFMLPRNDTTDATTPDKKTKDDNKSNKDDDDDEEEEEFVTRRIKVRALEQKSWQRLDPAGGGWGLFGFHTVPKDATEVVLTEGEYDAMAVWQATGRPAISLPNGCRSLPMEVLPMLEKFQKIYLWMDNDGPGQEGAKQFAQKIGMGRCYIVQPSGNDPSENAKDANEALQRGMDLEAMIQQASVTKHENVLNFDSIRQDVIHEILHPDEYTGVPMKSLPMLTNIIKGYRRGELTVLTGPTGSGKTTFLGQLSLDLAEQDVNVMWGSFEIKNTRLIQKLLQQFSRKPLPTGSPDAPALLHQLADRFSALPMYFMKFHGGSDLEDVLDAMEYAVYVSDVEHIILDNLQFMMSRNTMNNSFDKFDIQDIAIEKFRKFATDRNVHVTLVVHPRKEDESAKLSMSSIYGSAKATQEADTVMILQSENTGGRHRKYLEIKKNRYDGTLGYCPLHFDRTGGRYDDTPK